MATNFINRIGFSLIIGVLICSSCSKMNDLHDGYLQRGEKIYVSRLDTGYVLPGKEQVLIRFLNKDPKVSKLLVYWRSRSDSAVFDIPDNRLSDSIDVMVKNLPEDNHTFELITMNKESQYKSIVYEVNGNVYGTRFQASLINRAATAKEFIETAGSLTIRWGRAPQYAVATDVKYTDVNGKSVKQRILPAQSLSQFAGVAGDIEFRTLFLPEPKAIDTFYTDFTSLEPVVIKGALLDKSKFKRWNPAGIPYSGYTTSNWWIENAWNNSLATGFANNTLEFTFDMGQSAILSQLIINTRSEVDLIFNHQHPRKFQIWGSNTANVNPVNNNSFTGWTLLGEFVSVKPSASPIGTVTDADVQYASVIGEKYFISNPAQVRYIRFVCQETWGKLVGIQFMEMTWWGTSK